MSPPPIKAHMTDESLDLSARLLMEKYPSVCGYLIRESGGALLGTIQEELATTQQALRIEREEHGQTKKTLKSVRNKYRHLERVEVDSEGLTPKSLICNMAQLQKRVDELEAMCSIKDRLIAKLRGEPRAL